MAIQEDYFSMNGVTGYDQLRHLLRQCIKELANPTVANTQREEIIQQLWTIHSSYQELETNRDSK